MRKISLLFFTVILSVFLMFSTIGCGEDKKYDVKFLVDGEVYESIGNDGDEEIELPKTPTLGDLEFEGWFVDNGTFKVPFTSTYLIENPIVKDLNVYAKFKSYHNHYYDIEYIAKTCTTGGYKKYTCSCGSTYKSATEKELGHALGLYKEEIAPTCKTEGLERAACLRDGCTYSVTRVIPVSSNAHSFGEDDKCIHCGETKNQDSE